MGQFNENKYTSETELRYMESYNYFSLNNLPLGESAKVTCLLSKGKERRRMMDLGLITGTQIKAIQKSPAGDPVAYLFRGTVIALRGSDAKKIIIEH